METLHATIEEFAADGYTHIECYCPRCRVIRLRPMGLFSITVARKPQACFSRSAIMQSP